MDTKASKRYWTTTKYRSPDDAVVESYVNSKMDIIKRFISLEGISVLDVGCGNGTFMHYFASMPNLTVSGTDLSDAALLKNSSARLVRSSAKMLPFRDASFDMVFEANLLHHIDEPECILMEMKRVARKYVVLIEPNRANPVMFLFSLINRVERGGLRSSRTNIKRMLEKLCLKPLCVTAKGVITQNNTPSFLLSFLKVFEREVFFGAYIVGIAQKAE